MSTFEAVVDNVLTNDAKFQAWVQAAEAAILASGFLEIAPDTGQLDPVTVARPGAINTYAGYRIYRAKDALAATKPLYVRMDYGVATAIDRPKIQRTTGLGSNGAGTLTGAGGSMSGAASSASSSGSGTYHIYGGGGDTSAMLWMYDPGSTSHNTNWGIGRLIHQDDGSPSDQISWDFFSSTSQTVMGNYFWTDGIVPWNNTSQGLASHLLDVSQTINSGGDINTVLVYQPLVYRHAETLTFPMVVGKVGELPFTDAGSSAFSLDIWGGNHTFLPVPQTGPAGGRLAFLWD